MLYTKVTTATSGNNQIVAGVANKKIRVVAYVLVADSAVSVYWADGTTAVSGAMKMATGIPIPGNPMLFADGDGVQGHFETSQGADLTLNLSGNVQVSGHVAYILK